MEREKDRGRGLHLHSCGGRIKMAVQAEIIQSELNNQLEKLALYYGFSKLLLRH